MNPSPVDPVPTAVFPVLAKQRAAAAPGLVPSLARTSAGGFTVRAEVNGFPLDLLGTLALSPEQAEEIDADYQEITPIHPYFLRAGKNRLRAEYTFDADRTADDAPTPFRLQLSPTRWDYVTGEANKEITRFSSPMFKDAAAAKPGVLEGDFTWKTTLPAWGWTRGQAIAPDADSLKGLAAATRALWAELNALSGADAAVTVALRARLEAATAEFRTACEIRGKPSTFVADLVAAAAARALPGGPAGSLVPVEIPADENLRLQVFAGGTLARLTDANDQPVLAFLSTLKDGPRGQPNTVKISLDAWFRKNADGTWAPDALYPRTAPGTWSGFELEGRNLGELFRLSCF